MDEVLLYDTTLRDGTQGENITFSADEKINIAMRLDDFGIHYIEGGWPGSNPKDLQFFDLAKRIDFHQARLVAFGSTRKPGIRPDADNNLKALIASKTPSVAIFGKSWDLHVESIMKNTKQENFLIYQYYYHLKVKKQQKHKIFTSYRIIENEITWQHYRLHIETNQTDEFWRKLSLYRVN